MEKEIRWLRIAVVVGDYLNDLTDDSKISLKLGNVIELADLAEHLEEHYEDC